MKRLIALLIVLAGLAAAPVKLIGPTQVDAYKLVELAPDADTLGAGLIWDLDREDVADVREYGSRLVFVAPPGVYKIKLRIVKSDKDGKLTIDTVRHTVVIGKAPDPDPVPPGPTPPGPTPPGPTPDPAPIPVDGFRVLFVVDQGVVIPSPQHGVIFGAAVRDYLDRKCPKGSDGKTPEYRIWGKDTVPVGHAQHWIDVMKRPRKSYPWMVVSNGKTGYEGPVPGSVAEALELLKKHGGE